MSDAFEAVVEQVRQRVDPDRAEREHLEAVVEDLIDQVESALAAIPASAEVLLVGSTARGTWISGDRDVDLFICFPPDLDREDLRSYGLEIGRSVLPDGREEYAEHPYTVGKFEGYTVDLVPCYAVDSATEIKSAVDRTPFHTRYLDARLDADLAADVRVCKQFLKGIGAYGSDLRTRGFSGYLTELLVLEHGGFRPLLDAAADWHPPVRFDPDAHGQATFDDPLVVIDPTDPERNVAAALSAENLARFQHYAREALADPRIELFEADDPVPLSSAAIRARFDERATTPVAVRFRTPELVEDDLYPQLEKSRTGIADELDRRGFDVLRSAAFANETAVLLFELEVARRPAVERHEGPPVHVREHAEGFYETYASDDAVDGPFLDGDRYVVERDRPFTTALGVLDSDAIFDVALGRHVEDELEAGYDVLSGEAVATLADAFGTELARYLDPRP